MNIIKNINSLISKALREGTTADIIMNKDIARRFSDSINLAYKHGVFFARRSNLNYPYLLQDPKKAHRNPLSKTNYHEFYLDHNPAWKDFPKRYNSVMFNSVYVDLKTDGEYLQTLQEAVNPYYGKYLFMLFPENGFRLAVAPRDDMIDSFNLQGDLYTLNKYLMRLIINNCDVPNNEEYFAKSNAEFIDKMEELDIMIEKMYDYIDASESYRYFEINLELLNQLKEVLMDVRPLSRFLKHIGDIGLLQYFYRRFAPDKNNFEVITSNFSDNIADRKECWTDSTCLLVNSNQFLGDNADKFFEEFNNILNS